MVLWIDHLDTRIDKFDPVNFIIDVPTTKYRRLDHNYSPGGSHWQRLNINKRHSRSAATNSHATGF
jgi:hypothetical protein